MRQKLALALAALLILGGAGTVLGAQVLLRGREDAVTIEEEILYGDTEAAQGLRVTMETASDSFRYLLRWDTAFSPGGAGAADTVFTAEPQETSWSSWDQEDELRVEFDSPHLVYAGPTADQYFWDSQRRANRLYLPAKDVAGRTAPGEERTEVVDLADYYDVYPLHLVMFYGEFFNSNYRGVDQLTDFFRIPVPQGTMAEVTVLRNEAGEIEDASCTCEPDLPAFTVPVFTDTYAYCCFDASQSDVDVSQIAGGCGLFRLDYRLSYDVAPYLTLEKVSTVLPVEGAVKDVTARDGKLLVFSEEAGTLWLSVLEEESGAVLQRLAVMPVTGGASLYDAAGMEGGILVRLTGGAAAGVGAPAEGLQVGVPTDLSDEAMAPFFSDGAEADLRWNSCAAAFDGERLAVLYPLSGDVLPDLGLLVLSRDGTPVFAAKYRHGAHGEKALRYPVCESWDAFLWEDSFSSVLAFS